MLELKHKKLNVWNETIEFVQQIYRITQSFPSTENYILISQLKRAAISVASNLAEGSSRSSGLERARFYEISRSSLVEIDTQIEISVRLGYLKENEINEFQESLSKIYSMITKMISVNKK